MIHFESESLAEKLKDGGYDYVYAVPRGGYIPAVIVSHELNIPITSTLDVEGKVIVIDDVCDSGNTLQLYKDYDVAAVYMNEKNCKYPPKFYGRLVDEWVEFPYEQPAKDTVSVVQCSEVAMNNEEDI